MPDTLTDRPDSGGRPLLLPDIAPISLASLSYTAISARVKAIDTGCMTRRAHDWQPLLSAAADSDPIPRGEVEAASGGRLESH